LELLLKLVDALKAAITEIEARVGGAGGLRFLSVVPSGTYTLTLKGTSGATAASIPLTLTIP